MGQFSKVLLAIDNAHRLPQRALDGELGLAGLNRSVNTKNTFLQRCFKLVIFSQKYINKY